MNKVIYKLKGALATIFSAVLGYAIILIAFNDWASAETSIVFRFLPTRIIKLADEPTFFYAVISFYALCGLLVLIFAAYVAYKTLHATPETMRKMSQSSQFFFGKSDPGLLLVGGILILGFIALMLKTQFGW
jgi:hypothetical protein